MKLQEFGGFVKSGSRSRRLSGRKKGVNGKEGGIMAKVDGAKVGGLVFVLFIFFYLSNSVYSPPGTPTTTTTQGGPALRGIKKCQTVWCMSNTESLQFAVVADLDRQSKMKDTKKPTWISYFKKATLSRKQDDSNEWTIRWDQDVVLKSHLGEAGRGLELSELVGWKDALWTFDDRSGVVFELDKTHQCIPRYILMEGDGATTKGQKTEWATVKDNKLYVGSFGKPYTSADGETVTSRNNLWISVIDPSGAISHEDWTRHYNFMQKHTDSEWPGYMIHEAIHWDDIHKLWYVLPRRVSSDKYNEKMDEQMGSNLVLAFNEDFTKLEKKFAVGEKVATHGWSSFKFIPFTNNEVIIGLRTMELEDKETGAGEQETYITIFDVTNGHVILPEQLIPGNHKYEGIEFL